MKVLNTILEFILALAIILIFGAMIIIIVPVILIGGILLLIVGAICWATEGRHARKKKCVSEKCK